MSSAEAPACLHLRRVERLLPVGHDRIEQVVDRHDRYRELAIGREHRLHVAQRRLVGREARDGLVVDRARIDPVRVVERLPAQLLLRVPRPQNVVGEQPEHGPADQLRRRRRRQRDPGGARSWAVATGLAASDAEHDRLERARRAERQEPGLDHGIRDRDCAARNDAREEEVEQHPEVVQVVDLRGEVADRSAGGERRRRRAAGSVPPQAPRRALPPTRPRPWWRQVPARTAAWNVPTTRCRSCSASNTMRPLLR